MDGLKQNDIVSAYRFILGRDPEPGLSVDKAVGYFEDWQSLRTSLLASEEGRNAVYDNFVSHLGIWLKHTTGFGRQIYLCLSDIAVSKNIILTGKWEPEVEAGLRALFSPNMTFLDVGANIGWFTLLAADYVARAQAGGRVIAVEANPTILPYLMASIVESGLSNYVSVKPYAVAAQLGLVQMAGGASGNVGGLNIVPRSESSERSGLRNVVPTVRLDDLLIDLESLDLVKMDIEGAEPLAIEGFEKTLERHSPKIIMEINKEGLMGVSNSTVKDLYNQIRSLKYNCYDFRGRQVPVKMSGSELEDKIDQTSYYDFLFMRED